MFNRTFHDLPALVLPAIHQFRLLIVKLVDGNLFVLIAQMMVVEAQGVILLNEFVLDDILAKRFVVGLPCSVLFGL
jgi:hypothetical protein